MGGAEATSGRWRGFGTFFFAAALLGAASAPGTSPLPADARHLEHAEEGILEGAGGVALYYRVVGDDGPVVVAVHGGPGAGMESFSADLEPLTSEHRVIFYDQRGGGRSGLPEDESRLGVAWFVEDLEAVRRHFQLETMNLLAHSFGAVLVARYAQEHPDRVGRIALLGATGPRRTGAAPKPPEEQPSPEEAALQDEMREVLSTLLRGTAQDPVAVCRRYEALGKRLADLAGEPSGWQGSSCEAPPEAVAYYFSRTAQITPRSFGDWDFTGSLGAVSAPVLVTSGDRRSAALEQQREWAAAYPNGRLLVVAGAGKAAVATHPEVVFPALAEFFAAVPKAESPP